MADENKQALIDELRKRHAGNAEKLALVDELARRHLGAAQGVGAGGHVPGTPWTEEETAAATGEAPKRSMWDEVKDFAGGAVVDTAKGIGHMAKRIATPVGDDAPMEDRILNAILGPAGPLVGDMIKGQWETGKKAKQALEEGKLVEGAGYAAGGRVERECIRRISS